MTDWIGVDMGDASIAEFLEACWSLDERHAEKDIHMADRAGADWRSRHGINLPYSELAVGDDVVGRIESATHEAMVSLMHRFKPSTVKARAERTLAEIAAKREIIETHSAMENRRSGELVCSECSSWSDPYIDQTKYPCVTVRLLARPYRDLPDWHEGWNG